MMNKHEHVPVRQLLAHCWRCREPVYIGKDANGEVDQTAPDNRVRHFHCPPWWIKSLSRVGQNRTKL